MTELLDHPIADKLDHRAKMAATQCPVRRLLVPLAIALVACSADPVPEGSSGDSSTGEAPGTTTGDASTTSGSDTGLDSSGSDSSTGGDATTTSGSSTGDAESTDSTGTSTTTGGASGLGEISGECGTIDAMVLDSPDPSFFVNEIDFGRLGYDYDLLTEGGQEVFDDGNLGGSSLYSEVIAFEVLARCDDATLLATETEIAYVDEMGPKTDLLVDIADRDVGVSVTRAIAFPFEDPYEVADATTLLEDKLQGVIDSSANVSPKNPWTKQVLHVLAYAPMHADSLATAYEALSDELRADTVVVVTVTNGNDAFIYE